MYFYKDNNGNKVRKRIIIISIIFAVILSIVILLIANVQNINKLMNLKISSFSPIDKNALYKISVQNSKDRNYNFEITDSGTVDLIYNILSKAKTIEEKSSLESDYIFQFYENDNTVHKFNYIYGISNENTGNFYSEEGDIYKVNSEMDKSVIKLLLEATRPRDFYNVYYESIIQVINTYKSENEINNTLLNIKDDRGMLKYQFSKDLKKFQEAIGQISPNITFGSIVKSSEEHNYDLIINVTTKGYDTNIYKGIVEFKDIKNNITTNYYIDNTYEYDWKIKISDKMPNDF